MDSMGQKDGGKVGMSFCHGAGGNQLFRVTQDGQFRIHDQCAYKSSSDVRLRRCDSTRYQWVYNLVSVMKIIIIFHYQFSDSGFLIVAFYFAVRF